MSHKAKFQARVFLLGEEAVDLEIWVHELDPMDDEHLPGDEWVEEFLSWHDADWYREQCRVEIPAGDVQLLIQGRLKGWFDYWGEYDEEIEFDEVEFAEVPEDYLKVLRGEHDDAQ